MKITSIFRMIQKVGNIIVVLTMAFSQLGLSVGNASAEAGRPMAISKTIKVDITDPLPDCTDSIGCITINPSDPIHIAYALVIEGPNANLGIDSHNGVEIAIGDSGGEILGHAIQFDGQDEKCSLDGGAAAGAALAADPSIVAVIGTSCSGAARGAMPLLAAAGMVMISPSNTGVDLTESGNPNHYPGYFRTIPPDNVQGAAAAQFAISLGISTAATIEDGSMYADGIQAAFVQEFVRLGGTISMQASVSVGQTDMSEVLTSIASGSPDMIYFPIFIPEGSYIINQAHSTPGLESTLLMGSDGLYTPQVTYDTGANVEGFLVTGYDTNQYSPLYKSDFLPAYEDKFGTPLSTFHAQAYDAFMLIKAAIEKVADVDQYGTLQIGRQALRDALYSTTDFAGLTGSLTCSSTGDCAPNTYIGVFRYHAGQDQPLQVCPGATPPAISGYVYGPDGTTPLEGAWVVFENADTNKDLYGVQTDASGYYQCGLPAGDYHVKASNSQYSTVFYDQTYPDNAAVVILPDNAPVTANFTLDNPLFVFDNLIFNMTDPIVSDLAIRQAIAHGTDRQSMINMTYPTAVILNTFEPTRYWAYPTSGLPLYDYDPTEAQAILTDAGWVDSNQDGIRENSNDDPLSLILLTNQVDNQGHPRSRQVPMFVQDMADIGIQIVVDNSMDTVHDYSLIMVGWSGGDLNLDAGRPGSFAANYRSTNTDVNLGHYSNTTVDGWIGLAEAATTRVDKLDYLQDIEVQVMNDLAILPIAERIGDLIPMPSFTVRANADLIEAWDWPLHSTLTVNIYKSGVEEGIPDEIVTGTVDGPSGGGDPRNYASFNLSSLPDKFDIQPGYLVTVSDGIRVKKTIVTALAFDVMDKEADTVSGFAAPGSRVDVWACDNTNCYNRHVTAGIVGAQDEGKWVADWSVAGSQDDEKNTFDLVPGTWVDSSQTDADGDGTMFGQNIPNPFVEAAPYSGWIHARGWDAGTQVTLTIDNPSNGVGVDYTTGGIVVHNPGNPGDSNDMLADFSWPSQFVPGPGYVITMSGNVSGSPVTKTLVVSDLRVTSADPATGFVDGVATPGATKVEVCLNNREGNCSRYPLVNGAGQWNVDYSAENLQPGDNGWAAEYDNDNDRTWYDWRVFNPYIEGNPINNWLHARDWPKGTLLTVTIHDPILDQDVFTTTATMGQAPWNPNDPNDIVADIPLNGFDLKAGQTVHITDNLAPATERTYTFTNLSVNSFNVGEDTISGIGAAGVEVQVCANVPNNCISRYPTPDLNGTWTADFSGANGLDLVPGSDGWAAQRDANGNTTQVDWRVPNPYIQASPGSNWVQAFDWPNGAQLTLTINAGSPYTATVKPADWDNTQMVASFDLSGYDLQPGDTLVVTDGFTPRTYQPTDLSVTGFDLTKHEVSGMGTPGVELQVCLNIPGSCISRFVTPGADHKWTVSYSGDDAQYLVKGSNGWAAQPGNGRVNQTWADWNVPNPHFDAWYKGDSINAYDWPLGTELTLEIDDPGTLDPIDYSTTATVILAPWDSKQTVGLFDLNGFFIIQPGMTLTISGGGTTKSLLVSDLNVTSADPYSDIIMGTAGDNQSLWMNLNNSPDCCRYFSADSDGNWVVDYSRLGQNNEPIEALQLGSSGTLNATDEDGDNTSVGWSIPNPYFSVRANSDQVEASEWPLDSTIYLNIHDPNPNDHVQDYDGSLLVSMIEEKSGQTYAQFDLNAVFDIQPGYVVTMWDSVDNISKIYTVTTLHFTQMNIDTDIVSGIASHDSHVDVWACDNSGCATRHVMSDADGNWSVDFGHTGVIGDDPVTIDLVPGIKVDSQETGNSREITKYGMNVPSARIEIGLDDHWIHARDWPKGTEITLTIHPLVGGDVIERATIVAWNPQDPNDLGAEFAWPEIGLQPGFVVSMSGNIADLGPITRTLTIPSLTALPVDPPANIVSGTASPNTRVYVSLNTNPNVELWEDADASGNWRADFSDPGLQPGDRGEVRQIDFYGNFTQATWRVRNPWIQVVDYGGQGAYYGVQAYDWPLGATLEMRINGGNLSTGIVFTQPGWNGVTAAYFNNPVVIHAYDTVEVKKEGGFTKTYFVKPLAVTRFDMLNGTVSGTATQGDAVEVVITSTEPYPYQTPTADENGHWTAKFVDLQSGSTGWANVSDSKLNRTWVNWFAPKCHTLTLNTSPGGSAEILTPSNCVGGGYVVGTDIDILAIPDAGYAFASWGGWISNNNPNIVTMFDWDMTLTANFVQTCFTLATAVDPTGSGSVAISPAHNCTDGYILNTVVTLTANPAVGYGFTGWSGDASGSVSPVTMTMNADKMVTASFTLLPPGAFSKISPGNGAINVSSSPTLSWQGSAWATSYAYCIDTINNGSCDTSWVNAERSLNGGSSGLFPNTTYYWQVRALNAGVVSTEANGGTWWAFSTDNCYSLATNVSPGGTGRVNVDIGPNCAGGRYSKGTVVHLTATPTVGFSFSNWSGSVTGSTNPTTVTMIGNKSVTANFTQLCYTLTTAVNPSGSGNVGVSPAANCAGGKYVYGTVVTLAATAATGYGFMGWSGDAGGSNSPVMVTMIGNKSVTGYFGLLCYFLSTGVNPSGGGGVGVNPPPNCTGGRYQYGTVVTLTATPNIGYSFSSWSGGVSGSKNPVMITMTGDKSATSNFAPLCFTLTTGVNPKGGGIVTVNTTPNCASGKYTYGTVVTVTATAATGFGFMGWSGDAGGNINPAMVTMTGNKSVMGNFSPQCYTLTAGVNPIGSGSVGVSPAPNCAGGKYTYGTVVTLTATAATGYGFMGWSGDASGNKSSVKVTMNANKAVMANFSIK